MRALFFLLPLLMINACKTQTSNATTSENTTIQQMENKSTDCPEEGTCSVVVHKNKTLTVKDDGTGALYPELTDGTNTVVEYTYLKKGPEGTVDGDYSETIHFEIPAGSDNLSKANASLVDVKLLYGKHCYCKGQAGYYPITDGTLLLEKTGEGIAFDLKFNVGKTSQVVSHIVEMVKL